MDASDEGRLGRADSEGTDNPEANANQKDVSDKLFRVMSIKLLKFVSGFYPSSFC